MTFNFIPGFPTRTEITITGLTMKLFGAQYIGITTKGSIKW